MSVRSARGAIVIDTDVFSAELIPGSLLAERYAPLLSGRPAIISFQTVAELLYGALRANWGAVRTRRLEHAIESAEIVHTGPELVAICARLRYDCQSIGHALADPAHAADRWIAATAIRLRVPLVSNDQIFRDAPKLKLETIEPD